MQIKEEAETGIYVFMHINKNFKLRKRKPPHNLSIRFTEVE